MCTLRFGIDDHECHNEVGSKSVAVYVVREKPHNPDPYSSEIGRCDQPPVSVLIELTMLTSGLPDAILVEQFLC